MSKIHAIDSLRIEKLPSPAAIKQELPVPPHVADFIQSCRRQVTDILEGLDPRMLLIIGPCSIHDIKAAEEYAVRLRHLTKDVARTFFILMRTYFEKPRSSLGWKGMLYDPAIDGSNDIVTGIRNARELLLTLAKLEIPAATEFLDPATPSYIGDLISWSCIGARTSESQIHRQVASGLPMPIAFKNSTSGNVETAINGVVAAQQPHTCFGIDDAGQLSIVHTKGNRHAHIALRGGEDGPNYHPEAIAEAVAFLKRHHLPQRLVVDCSHDNSSRRHEMQKPVFKSLIDQVVCGNEAIRGICLESHLNGGNQAIPIDLSRIHYAVSLTDPCLDWDNTEELIRWGDALLAAKDVSKATPCFAE